MGGRWLKKKDIYSIFPLNPENIGRKRGRQTCASEASTKIFKKLIMKHLRFLWKADGSKSREYRAFFL